MLELKQIVKDYPAGSGTVHALKGVSLRFRDSEFVSVLGQSGCGKTTMLNIIGGLDRYTSGDLLINGVSTKAYKDRDWDAYRNHSVGFIFQSYNLIPHQSVLRNVELALTLSGVSRSERRRRAEEALEKVGLGDQMHKKPNSISGGQMQRVAIARAIVNDPDIILADEPTGALDSETGIQVMDILKKISKDRLVIMVTHNPELAERYSTRIVRIKDGEILSDSRPVSEEEWETAGRALEEERKKTVGRRVKKPSMSLATSFGLSLKNLVSKKGRTLLTAFAGSIGIIGIALIYAVSYGTTAYIDSVQEDTLSSYPLVLESRHTDLGGLMKAFISSAESNDDHPKDAVYQKTAMYDLANAMANMDTQQNDLKSFKKYLEKERADESDPTGLRKAVSGVQYTYDLAIPFYFKDENGKIVSSDLEKMVAKVLARYMGRGTSDEKTEDDMLKQRNQMLSMFAPGAGTGMEMWQELLPGDGGKPVSPMLEKQYDVVYGRWPEKYDEIVVILDKNNEIDDMSLYALGLKSEDEIDRIVEAAVDKKHVDAKDGKWSYEDVCSREYVAVLNASCYVKNEKTGIFTDLRTSETGLKYLYDNGIRLRVTGIIRPKEGALSAMLKGSIGYTSALTRYVAEKNAQSEAIAAQKKDPSTDIFTGLRFREKAGELSEAEKANEFREIVKSYDQAKKAEIYAKIQCIPSKAEVDRAVKESVGGMTRKEMEESLAKGLSQQTAMSEKDIHDYVSGMSDQELRDMFDKLAEERFRAQYAEGVMQSLRGVPPEQLAQALDQALPGYGDAACAEYHDAVLEFSDSTYEDNLKKLGDVDLDDPASINLYAASFDDKKVIEDAIAKYNEGVDKMSRIQYTDYVAIMMNSVTTIINAITYVLMAFVAVSLIVSSIMIGVITLISVQERTKEIGILRALGASKRNVSGMFNAETLMIGFGAGLLGVLVTYLLCIPINSILHEVTGIKTLSAELPVSVAAILVLISMTLTLIAGVIPSRSAAKKDPVVALRTE